MKSHPRQTDVNRVSTRARLAGFTLLLVVLFAGAAALGGAIGPARGGESAAAMEENHSGSDAPHAGEGPTPGAADPVRGLAVSDNGLTLALEQSEIERGRSEELRFSIVASGGRTVRDFEVEHEKRMHLIVVRRDGQGFQHLHPELGEDGVWRTPITLPDAGSYRVFADFKHDGRAQTLATDLGVDGEAAYRPLLAPARSADAGDGYRVRLDAPGLRAGDEAELRFSVSRYGRSVRTEPYLGAGGHLVAMREGDLAYLHVHPGGDGDGHGESASATDSVGFMTEFPSEGRYRLYLQFRHEGQIRTAEFTREVAR